MSHKDEDCKTNKTSPSKPSRESLKRHPSFQAKLNDMKEVKKLHISEEKFSYYDEYKTFELGAVKTLKPQFMYDAAEARKKDQERAAQARYEGIRSQFWEKWEPRSVATKKPPKIFGKGLSSLRPFNIDIMKAFSPEEDALLKESCEMYREAVNRSALDAIEFNGKLHPPSSRMKRLPRLVTTLRARIDTKERKQSNLFVQGSETSSVENVKEWIKHLNPYASVQPIKKRISVYARRARTSIPRLHVKPSNAPMVPRTRHRKTKSTKRRQQPLTVTKKGQVLHKTQPLKTSTTGVLVPLDGTYSTISLEQLLASTKHSPPPTADSGAAGEGGKRKVNPAKRALELREEIEMVRNLTVTVPAETSDSKASTCKLDPSQLDTTMTERWQERRLYYQKQQGIDYDINYNHPCLQPLTPASQKKGAARTPQ